ncbi:MAG: LysM peptidoglycan-binding domain-containing protein [Actinobacteria bacterium]|nr:LysM peptidoglycan-binding domain-containing protein [Actinomycetota bacterium]
MRAAPSRPGADKVLTPSAVIAPPLARRVASPAPIRLTRRGRRLVVALAVTVIAAIWFAIGVAVAGGAGSASGGQDQPRYKGMREIVVRQGQTLWSIASAAEPGDDPRDVVAEIMSANALPSADLSPGQLLWVPR